ncbi:unnamed protein product [Adineta ricciae]|uniref:Tetratricopeptide repeat protein n=1 Tax=Adineta ricciae TaxID=249248 RepID=A0A815E2J3_ADIRI|nr:unnamed protein product [Adineta ricciae]CAF1301247.1 unnamed protein product [Adineta ricciae]
MIAEILHGIRTIRDEQEKYGQALKFYEQSLSTLKNYYSSAYIDIVCFLHYIMKALTMLDTYYPSYLLRITSSLNYFGNILRKQQKLDEAFDVYKRALTILEESFGSDHTGWTPTLTNIDSIGDIYKDQNNNEESLNYYQKGLEVRKLVYPLYSAKVAYSLNYMALAIVEKIDPDNYILIAAILGNIGNTLSSQKRFEGAFDFQQRSLNLRKTHCPSEYASVALNYNSIGDIRYQEDKYRDQALEFFQKALTIKEEFSPTNYTFIALLLYNIGYALSGQGKYRFESLCGGKYSVYSRQVQ